VGNLSVKWFKPSFGPMPGRPRKAFRAARETRGRSIQDVVADANRVLRGWATPEISLNCSWLREWRFRNSFNLAIKSLPVVHFDTSPAYPVPAALNSQGMMVFFFCKHVQFR